MIDNHGELFLLAVDRKEAQRLSLKVRRVLMEHSSNNKMSVLQFQMVFQSMFGESLSIETIQEKLNETANVIDFNLFPSCLSIMVHKITFI